MTSHGQTTAAATLVDLLRHMAAEEPDARVMSALGGEGPAGSAVTFAELDVHARAIAAALQRAGVLPGERAVLFYPTGAALLPALFGCLYAGVVAVPAPLPDVEGRTVLAGPSQWLLSLLRVCRPAVFMSGIGSLVACRAAMTDAEGLSEVPWLCTDAVSSAGAGGWREVPITPETAALLPPGAGDAGAVSHARLLGGPAAFGLARATAGWLPMLQDYGRGPASRPERERGPGIANTAPEPAAKGRAGSGAA